MAVILDKESTITMFSVLSCGHGSHLVHVDNNHLSFYSALWFAIGFKTLQNFFAHVPQFNQRLLF